VFRGGYGIFYTQDSYDYYPLVQNPPLSTSINCGGAGCPPVINLKTGPPVAVITTPAVINSGSGLHVIPKDQKTESVQEYNLTWQWQIGREYLLDLGYVGTQARHLLAARQLGSNGNGLGFALAPDGSLIGQVVADESRADANYNSLQAHLEKRLSFGLLGGLSYTYSHGIDNSTGVFNGPGDTRGNAGGPINPFNFNVDRGNSSLDHRHVFVANGIYDLPFGRGRQYAANVSNATDYVIGGWQLNTIFNASSGQHFSVDADNGNGVKTYAILIPGADPYAHTPGLFLNPAAFLAPTAANGATCVTNLAGSQICYGNSGRNRFTGPSFFRTDMSLFKNIKFTERVSMQLGIEFYNIFNNDDHVIPEQGDNANIGPNTGFGRFNNALPPRTGQYRAKIIF
jgi:hypothetical protein